MLRIAHHVVYIPRSELALDPALPPLGQIYPAGEATEAIMHHTTGLDNDSSPNVWENIPEVFANAVIYQTIRPDLGLDNPYCMTPETRVLTADLRWVPLSGLSIGQRLIGFDEDGPGRRWRWATVTNLGRAQLPCYRIKMEDGTEFTASNEHRWLSTTGQGCIEWRTTKQLSHPRPPQYPSTLTRVSDVWDDLHHDGRGYLAGVFDADGTLGVSRSTKRGPIINWLSLCQKDNILLETAERDLGDAGYRTAVSTHQKEAGTYTLHVRGGFPAILRFLGEARPPRLLEIFAKEQLGGTLRTEERVRVESIEDVGPQEVVTIRTDTGTFVAEGFACHNSYLGYLMRYRTGATGFVLVEGRGAFRRGAHTQYHNRTGRAIGLVGNFELEFDLRPYLGYISEAWGWIKSEHGLVNLGAVTPQTLLNQPGEVFGHRQLNAYHALPHTACPGGEVMAHLDKITIGIDEEDDMQPFLAWDLDNSRIYLVGPWGASWITKADDVEKLEAKYGEMAEAFSGAFFSSLNQKARTLQA